MGCVVSLLLTAGMAAAAAVWNPAANPNPDVVVDATSPSPGNGDVDVRVFLNLNWTAGAYAVSHDVYFGTDPIPDETEFQGNQTGTTFDPGVLDLNTTYYWRIDEIDPEHPEGPWTGDVWSFTTHTTGLAGKIVYPWRSTTAIVKAGESFEVWFDADPGQTVEAVELRGPYKTVCPAYNVVTGDWEYDPVSGNRYDKRLIVTVPLDAPADRYDLVLNTNRSSVTSVRAVKVIREHKASYRILHLSDSHLKQHKNPEGLIEAKLTAIVDMSNIINPEMVFVTGDNITWTPGDFQCRLEALFAGDESAGFKGLYDLHTACFVAAGNHDYEEAVEDRSCCFESKSDFWNRYYGLQYHAFTYGNTRCMVINNGWHGYDFGYQLTDLANWLDGEGAGGKLRLAAFHNARKEMTEPFVNNCDIGLAIVGHNHHLGDTNPYLLDNRPILYYALSVREYCEFNLFQVDDRTGNCEALGYVNADPATEGHGLRTGSCRILENDDQKANTDTAVWVYNLTLDYARRNDGTASGNTATLVNKFDFAIPDARVRFIMPKGATYGVSGGTVEQQFDGDWYRIVDVSVDLDANSSTKVGIVPIEISVGDSARGEHPTHDETADKVFDGDVQTK